MSKEEFENLRKKLSKNAKERWRHLSDKKKQEALGSLQRAQRGSKAGTSHMERMVGEELEKRGYKIMRRTKNFTPGGSMEIDIAIMSEKIAIEIDGPSHFKKLYDDDSLDRKIASDKKKNKYINDMGWTMIRAQDHTTSPSLIAANRAADDIEQIIKSSSRKKINIVEIK
jgi:very-short-patch-repair endonuclease